MKDLAKIFLRLYFTIAAVIFSIIAIGIPAEVRNSCSSFIHNNSEDVLIILSLFFLILIMSKPAKRFMNFLTKKED